MPPTNPTKLRWIARPHDTLHVACRRVQYVNLVRRAAQGTPGPRDDFWLAECQRDLKLQPTDFADDVSDARAGKPPRQFPPDLEQIDVQETIEPDEILQPEM